MTQKKITKSNFWLILSAILVFALVIISMAMAKTSSTSYCMSCHEMETYKTELEASSHAVDADNNTIECKQCHIPNNIGLNYVVIKVISGVKDQWVHTFGDPSNLDRKRLQKVAVRFLLDDNCRECHQDLFKTTKNEEISEIGKLSHEAYLGENGNTKSGCAGCHPNMAHLPDFDRRFEFNHEFSKKLSQSQE